MSTVSEIEAALPALSPEELARIETVLRRIQGERHREFRLDGRPWPATAQEVAALLTELDDLPPLLTAPEAERFDAWRAAEKERQKMAAAGSGKEIGKLFT